MNELEYKEYEDEIINMFAKIQGERDVALSKLALCVAALSKIHKDAPTHRAVFSGDDVGYGYGEEVCAAMDEHHEAGQLAKKTLEALNL